MNYLLVMPRLVSEVGQNYLMPIGICYISSSLKKAGYNVHTLNLNHRQGEIYDILNHEIHEKNIDVLAVGGLTIHYNKIDQIINYAKCIKNEIITIIGGGIITASPMLSMTGLTNADYGIIGEGEYAICELADALENNKDISSVNGLIYRNNNELKASQKRDDISDLGSIPWPDYDGFEMQKLIDTIPQLSNLGADHTPFQMLTSRSCAYNCTFCFHSSGKKYRQRPLDDIFAEIEHIINKYKIDFISFIDELFAIDVKRTKIFCEKMKSYNISWSCQMRVDIVTTDILSMLKGSGCTFISYGIESMDDTVLKSMKKNITALQIKNALKLTTDAGIETTGNLIFGDIEETMQSVTTSLDWYKQNDLCKITVCMIQVFPGTYLYDYAVKNGIITNELEFIKNECPLINLSKLTDQQYHDLHVKCDNYNSRVSYSAVTDFEIININKNLYTLTIKAICPHCGKENILNYVDLLFAFRCYCNNCNNTSMILSYKAITKYINENFVKYLANNNKIAIWGARGFLYDFIDCCSALADDNISIIDINPSKQQIKVNNKNIYSPDILKSKDYTTVIIAVYNNFDDIKAQIKRDFPHVSKIIHIYDFIINENIEFPFDIVE